MECSARYSVVQLSARYFCALIWWWLLMGL